MYQSTIISHSAQLGVISIGNQMLIFKVLSASSGLLILHWIPWCSSMRALIYLLDLCVIRFWVGIRAKLVRSWIPLVHNVQYGFETVVLFWLLMCPLPCFVQNECITTVGVKVSGLLSRDLFSDRLQNPVFKYLMTIQRRRNGETFSVGANRF